MKPTQEIPYASVTVDSSDYGGNKNMAEAPILIILTIVELLLRYGAPTFVKIINDWHVQNPTVEDFLSLNELLKDPESYFEDKN